MIKAANCCNQHLKNIIILRHFQFCCLWFLKAEDKQPLVVVFRGLASFLLSPPLPARAAHPLLMYQSATLSTAKADTINSEAAGRLAFSMPYRECQKPHVIPFTHQWNPSSSILVSSASEMYLSHQLKPNFSSWWDTITDCLPVLIKA